ncbi:MAG: HNH endonuclease [Fibrobacteraceae bacterium]|nr:HNH endonuclease [Fibrobacteraceae bacterium]
MTFAELDTIKKAGLDSGWGIVESESLDAVVFSSASHDQLATVRCFDHEIDVEFSIPVDESELHINGAYSVIGRVIVVAERDYETLRAILNRSQELFVALPTNPVEIYNTRWQALVAQGIAATETVEEVKRRVGQDVYREALENYWKNACAVTGCTLRESLRASHAKPWADCENAEECLSAYNGFLLTANLDALFDKGLITFDDEGRIVISESISSMDLSALGIVANMRLRWVDEKHKPFLKYHREHVWKG